jgi:hypothetical protein
LFIISFEDKKMKKLNLIILSCFASPLFAGQIYDQFIDIRASSSLQLKGYTVTIESFSGVVDVNNSDFRVSGQGEFGENLIAPDLFIGEKGDLLTSILSGMDDEILNISSDIATNTSAITTNSTDIATNTSAITSNDTDIATNTSAITTNSTDIATNTSAITTNSTDIATNTSAITTNSTDIATNTSAITTNSTDIATNTSAITAMSSQVSQNSAEILITNKRLEGIYDELRNEDSKLSKRINLLESGIDNGLASVIAMSHVAFSSEGGLVSVGVGKYNGGRSAAIGYSYAGERAAFKVTIAKGGAVGAGVSFKFK